MIPVEVGKKDQEDGTHVVDNHLEKVVALSLGKLVQKRMCVIRQLAHVIKNDAVTNGHEGEGLEERTNRLSLSAKKVGKPFIVPKQVEARACAGDKVRKLKETNGKPLDTHLSFFG